MEAIVRKWILAVVAAMAVGQAEAAVVSVSISGV